jgi:cytochrome oxidase Cu insertion factor (SCO1/SenC/PrrC family)
MMRWLATAGIALLFVLNLALPYTGIGRRGSERALRADAALPVGVGERLPPLVFEDLDGQPVRLADLRGHRVLLTFERSVDW